MKVEREEVREVLRGHTSSIENGSEQNHKLIGRKITSEGLVALLLPQKLQKTSLKHVKMKMEK